MIVKARKGSSRPFVLKGVEYGDAGVFSYNFNKKPKKKLSPSKQKKATAKRLATTRRNKRRQVEVRAKAQAIRDSIEKQKHPSS